MVNYENLKIFDKVIVTTKKAIVIGQIYNVTKIQELTSIDKLIEQKSLLNELGIQLKDENNEYRRLEDILVEIHNKWNMLLDSQQKQIIEAFSPEDYKTIYIVQISATDNSTIRFSSEDIVSIEKCKEQ